MEKLQTVGREFYKGNVFDIYLSNELSVLEGTDKDQFQLMYVDEGSVLIRTGDTEQSIFAPVLLCINYRLPISGLSLSGARGFSVFFRPGVINHGLAAELPGDAAGTGHDCAAGDSAGSGDSGQFHSERILLVPFLKADGNPYPLPVNGSIRNRLLRMRENMQRQLVGQPDDNWPCRGRSFFLEMLMLLQSLFALETGSGSVSIQTGGDFYPVIREIHVRYPEPSFVCRPARQATPTGALVFPLRFRRSVGQYPSQYVRRLRCSVGANLLKNTMLNVGEIARRCGYPDERRFTGDFRTVEGLLPLDWRARFPNPYG